MPPKKGSSRGVWMCVKGYEFKITLQDVEPEISRTFVCPMGFDLEMFHHVIQRVMGWGSSHLYSFHDKDGKEYSPENPLFDFFGDNDDDGESNAPTSPSKVIVGSVFKEEGDGLLYVYDMGDDWTHSIELISKNPKPPRAGSKKLVYVIEGSGRCPPEDCGGSGGYQDFCEAVLDPKHPEHNHMIEWAEIPKRFHSPAKMREYLDTYDIKKVNTALKAFDL